VYYKLIWRTQRVCSPRVKVFHVAGCDCCTQTKDISILALFERNEIHFLSIKVAITDHGVLEGGGGGFFA